MAFEFSAPYKSSNNSSPSPNGCYIATLLPPRLVVRSTSSLDVTRSLNVNAEFANRVSFLRWSPKHGLTGFCSKLDQRDDSSLRILLADDETVRVWDLKDEEWTAEITAASGGVSKIANVEFGSNADEVLVHSEFGVKLMLWNLSSGRSVEIKDPKFVKKGYGYRPITSHFALLSRPSTHDTITLHSRGSYNLISSWTLPTVDAQNLKWSPCGRWIAVWDSAASGYKVLVYTADGHLYRTFTGGQESGFSGLGVKSVEWSPQGKYLAIGDFDKRITMLSNFTFSPVIFLDHSSTIKLPGVPVWQEQVSPSGQRSYALAVQPTYPPTIVSPPNEPNPKIGISTISFNNFDGTLIATKRESMPTTVWIWCLKTLAPCAILVQHSAIKTVSWHPTIINLLMVQCVNEDGVVYLWNSDWEKPQATKVPLGNLTGSHSARWIFTGTPRIQPLPSTSSVSPTSSKPSPQNFPIEHVDPPSKFLFSDTNNYVIGTISTEDQAAAKAFSMLNVGRSLPGSPHPQPWESKGEIDYFTGGQHGGSSGHSAESAPESGSSNSQTPLEIHQRVEGPRALGESMSSDSAGNQEDVDDTFHYRTGRKGPVKI